jgi:hypothetical protein
MLLGNLESRLVVGGFSFEITNLRVLSLREEEKKKKRKKEKKRNKREKKGRA